MEKLLERAFARRAGRGGALVNSPGGSPTQSALVADRIRGWPPSSEVPVLAFCEDVAASGGYWLACAADEIYAHPTSIVGSIGVISQGFGLDGLLERFGVQRGSTRRVSRRRGSTRSCPEKPEDVAWLRGLQDQLHEMFREWVRARRASGSRRTRSCSPARCGPAREPSSWAWWTAWAPRAPFSAERFPDAELVPVEGRATAARAAGPEQAPGRGRARPADCRAARPGGRDPRNVGAVRSVARM